LEANTLEEFKAYKIIIYTLENLMNL